jgi:hypothetical protein
MTRHWLWLTGAFALLVSACATTPPGPQGPIDLPSVLVGTWKGDVQMSARNYPFTLVIKSVREVDGRATADAEYEGGIAAARHQPVTIKIEAYGKDVVLRFATVEAWVVELSLYPDWKHLFGNLNIPVAMGGTLPVNPVDLGKVD